LKALSDPGCTSSTVGSIQVVRLLHPHVPFHESPDLPFGVAPIRHAIDELAVLLLRVAVLLGSSWTSYEKLREVIERRMFSQVEELLPVISFGSKKDSDTEKNIRRSITSRNFS
jgi:hypothetical protein